MTQKSITMTQKSLYYREGSSDKVYHIQLVSSGAGYLVNVQYGRRNASLQCETKTQVPVSLSQAEAIFNKVLREKLANGYTEGRDGPVGAAYPKTRTGPVGADLSKTASGVPYAGNPSAGESSGLGVMLLNPVEESDLEPLLSSPDWLMQEKLDGRRLLVRKAGTLIQGANRRGLIIPLSEPLQLALGTLPGDFVLDGESIGDTFYPFDLLERDGQNLHGLGYATRHARMLALLARPPFPTVRPVPIITHDKKGTLETLRREFAEGVVFKRADAPYRAGRPASGGDALKFKFYKTLSAVVSSCNAKRSVNLQLEGNIPLGSVTVGPNFDIPKPGAVVEVRYLYAFPGGALCQPLFLGVRDDVLASECSADQLIFKADHEL